MDKIKKEDLKNKIINIKAGEQIFINIDQKITDHIELLKDQIDQIESLFHTYVVGNKDIKEDFDVEKIINLLQDKMFQYKKIYWNTIISSIGEENYIAINDLKYKTELDTNINYIIIYKEKYKNGIHTKFYV